VFIEPMYAKSASRESLTDVSTKKGWGDYVADVKQDGVRCVIVHDEEGINLYTRTGNLLNTKFPQLEEELAEVLPYGSVIDGEVAFIDHAEKIGGQDVPVVSFNKTMRIVGSLPEKARANQVALGKEISLILFDVLKWRSQDLLGMPQIDRIDLIYKEFDYTIGNPMSKIWLGNVYTDPSDFLNIYDQLTELGVEGLILKNRSALYSTGKRANKSWYKIKTTKTAEVIVTGYTEGNGKYEGMIGAVEFSAYQDGELVRVGRCSGLTNEERQDITDHQDEYLGRVFEVKFNDLVGSGEYRTPRHPNFLHWRFDKLPEQCLREQFK